MNLSSANIWFMVIPSHQIGFVESDNHTWMIDPSILLTIIVIQHNNWKHGMETRLGRRAWFLRKQCAARVLHFISRIFQMKCTTDVNDFF